MKFNEQESKQAEQKKSQTVNLKVSVVGMNLKKDTVKQHETQKKKKIKCSREMCMPLRRGRQQVVIHYTWSF